MRSEPYGDYQSGNGHVRSLLARVSVNGFGMSIKNKTKTFKMPQLQEIGTDMLRQVAQLCEEENINYCLFLDRC